MSAMDRAAFASRLVEAGCPHYKAELIADLLWSNADGQTALVALRRVLNDSEKPEPETCDSCGVAGHQCYEMPKHDAAFAAESLTAFAEAEAKKRIPDMPGLHRLKGLSFGFLTVLIKGERQRFVEGALWAASASAVSAPPASASSDAPANAEPVRCYQCGMQDAQSAPCEICGRIICSESDCKEEHRNEYH